MLNMEERMLVAAISKEMAKAKEEKQKQRENDEIVNTHSCHPPDKHSLPYDKTVFLPHPHSHL